MDLGEVADLAWVSRSGRVDEAGRCRGSRSAEEDVEVADPPKTKQVPAKRWLAEADLAGSKRV